MCPDQTIDVVPGSVPRRGRPPKIDRERIVHEALELGLVRVSMTRVASRLGVTDAALYHHFRGLEELRGAMTDALVAQFELPQLRGDWQEWLQEFGRKMRQDLRRHPGAAAVLSRRGPISSGARGIVETVVVRLVEDFGFETGWAARAYSLVSGLAISSVVREEAYTRVERHEPTFAEVVSLDDSSSEVLREVARVWAETSWDGDFEDGLRCILAGVAQKHGGARRA